MIESPGLSDFFSGLTAKQREVLDLLADNHTTKEIARKLGISPFAVDQRLRSAKGHIGPLSRGELTRLYRELSGQLALVVPNSPNECEAPSLVEQESVANPSYALAAKTSFGPLSAGFVLDQARSFRFVAGMTLGFSFGVMVSTASWLIAAFTVKALVT